MADFRERYKRVGIGREDMAANRALRSQRRDEARRDARTDHFSLRRDMREEMCDDEDEKVSREKEQHKDVMVEQEEENKNIEDLEDKLIHKRLLELKKWKEEKKKRRLQEKKQAKPAFKVGVVHHRIYSPPIKKDPVPLPPTRLCRSKQIHIPESPPKRVTRATEKRLAIKALNQKQKREDLRTKKKVKEKVLSKVKNQKDEKALLIPNDFQFKAPLGVTAIPMFGRQALDTAKNNRNLLSSDEVSSSIAEFGKSLSCGSDSVFTINDHSSIFSISSSTHSNVNTSNLRPPDSSSTKSCNSLNKSSEKEVNLKFPTDNQEMLIDQDSPSIKTLQFRRSRRLVSEETTSKKDSSLNIEDQQILENQENIDNNIKNLIDYSISDFNKISPFKKKKSMHFAENLQNQSLMKFSPRRSTRYQTVNSSEQSDVTKATKSKNTEATLNQSTKRLSIPKNNVSTHTNLEPMDQIITEKDESVNQSLNMSIPRDSSIEKPPAFFSPYVVSSRGKDRVRKEIQRRRFSQISPKDIPTKETVMQTLNISVEEEQRTSQYYKFILDKEINRLNEMCDCWNIVKEDPTTPEDIHYEIQAAVGQTQLLINKKFKRFRGLVLDCETGKGEMLVTCKDLQGFWEMMYMEIKDCDNRFSKLEEKKAKNWIVEETEEGKKEKIPKKKPVASKKPAAKKKPVTAKSSLRAHIIAARRKMEAKDSEIDVDIKEAATVKENDIPQEVTETFKNDGTPMKNIRRSTSTPKSANKWQSSLLKVVQSSQSRKATTSPLIVMKLSQMCKTPDVQLDDSIVYINSDRTPAKSILKSSKEELLGSVAKSTHKVFFKEQPTEFREIENNIENNDEEMLLDNTKSKEPIERRLDFENDSFNSSHLEDDNKKKKEQVKKSADSLITLSPSSIVAKNNSIRIPKIIVNERPLISMSPLSLQDQKEESSVKKKNRMKKTITFKDDSIDSPIRSLRTRKLSTPGTPIRPKLRNSERDNNEDLRMEVDDSCLNDNENSLPKSQQVQTRQLYLNEEGIICERMIPVKGETPRTIKLRRANSEAIRRNTRSNAVKDSEPKARNTPTTRQRNFIEVVIDSPSMQGNAVKSSEQKASNTPTIRKKNFLEVIIDSPPNSENKNINSTPNSCIKILKARKIPKNNNLSLKESTVIQPTIENSNCTVLTPKLKRKNSENSQENIESNEKKNDEDVNDRIKVSRSSSIKKRNSKKYLDLIDSSKQEFDRNSTNEILTPTTIRRRSSRVTNRSIQEKRKFEDIEKN